MKALFVSGVAAGGAPKSTLELARLLAERGHEVQVLLTERPGNDSVFGLVTRAHIKLAGVPGLGELTGAARRRFGRRVSETSHDANLRVLSGIVAENAAPALVERFRPDVVVANSLPRIGLRTLADELGESVPLVLYMREAHSITHLTISGLRPAATIANAREFCDQVEELGLQASFVPSIIDLSASETETTRRSVLMINPIAENRPELFAEMARRRPDVHFVLQESWPLPAREFAALESLAAELPNLEVRHRFDSPADVYADARLLVATYPTNRPRVIVEAQYNGIPVVALDQPSLVEAAGPMDTVVPADATDEAWLQAVVRYVDDPEFYAAASVAAASWARRPEISADKIVSDFENALAPVLHRAEP